MIGACKTLPIFSERIGTISPPYCVQFLFGWKTLKVTIAISLDWHNGTNNVSPTMSIKVVYCSRFLSF